MVCEARRGWFHDAEVAHEGRTVRLTADEARGCQGGGDAGSGPGRPSTWPATWLATAVFMHARGRLGLPDPVAVELAARSLGVAADDLRGKLTWHDDVRWHDDDPDDRVP